jgi:hypothetical protein
MKIQSPPFIAHPLRFNSPEVARAAGSADKMSLTSTLNMPALPPSVENTREITRLGHCVLVSGGERLL